MKRLLFSLCMPLLMQAAHAQVSFGQPQLMNDGWRFLRIDSTQNVKEEVAMRDNQYNDARWQRVTLPHDWGVTLPMSPDKGSCQGYLTGGVGWYRKHFTSTDAPKQFVYFEGVYNYSEVYLNGHLLGCRPSGFASFLYDLTPYLNKEGDNVLAVRVDHSQQFDSRWYTGSGIYRNVWLVEAPEVHLAQWGTAYRLKSINAKKAVVEVDVETTDDRQDKSQPLTLQAVVELKDAQGKIVASATTKIGAQEKKTVTLTVPNPQRWTLDSPYLYTLSTLLSPLSSYLVPRTSHLDSLSDRSVVKAGLRTLDFSADRGFALNGEWMKVKGVCLHDDAGVLGTAVPSAVWERRLKELKAIGVNAIRMSHNPHAPELYDLCDELGLLVMDEASDEWEFPKRKWMKGWNQGRPEYQGTYTYFEEWIERDVADMVRRDRCHPSVFMWSIGNEVDYPNDPYSHPVLNGDGSDFTQPIYGGYQPSQPNAERIGHIAQRLAKVVRAIDSSRPTTGALAGVVMSNATAYPDAIDVVGYNYTESRYGEDHRNYPQRVIYGSENRHDLRAWRAVSDNKHIFGQFLWTGIDYLGESGPWPSRGSTAGLLDLAGHRKPLGWYRAALWSQQPTCYLGTSRLPKNLAAHRDRTPHCSPYAPDRWNYRQGDRIRVMCYTNATDAQLFLNGQPVAGKPKLDPESAILYWDVDYEPGTLLCKADNGATYELHTTKAPHALRVTTDSVAHVFVEVVDEDGRLVPDADNEIFLHVEGARLLGIENGNINDTGIAGNLRSNRRRTYGGRLVAYIAPRPGERLSVWATSLYM